MADGSRASVFLARGSTAETFELSEVLGEIGGAKDVWTGDSVDVAERLVVAPHSAELIITN